MAEVASRYVQHVNAPLMVDSTQADVIEAALKRAGGRCIVNSINLEDGERRLDEICPLLRRYGVVSHARLLADRAPIPWRLVLRALRGMELRGEVRGGRFVNGEGGEQYARTEAVVMLRAERERRRDSPGAARSG